MGYELIENEVEKIETHFRVHLPPIYRNFLIKTINDIEPFEVTLKNGDNLYLYNYKDLIERNTTYGIQEAEASYMLIGQDGDLGYFISLMDECETIYSVDLGGLGSLSMDVISENINLL